ncbi:hypothetical protein [Bosea sp. NBC_00550]|uniref:hypothetical protein n=1 Tax=Bosea sp. NBC_00550 TaxID=2969621 RepID=UPI00223175D7|nr:hypothetical protein [Bosea sp. NBC_00550]UZF91286.1 hypothetical protein NWE53_19475 [Bosea sp. NBC_00550]
MPDVFEAVACAALMPGLIQGRLDNLNSQSTEAAAGQSGKAIQSTMGVGKGHDFAFEVIKISVTSSSFTRTVFF